MPRIAPPLLNWQHVLGEAHTAHLTVADVAVLFKYVVSYISYLVHDPADY